MWHVTVQNMTETIYSSDEIGRVACKFTLSEAVSESMTIDQFEQAMCLSMISAIRKIKAEMIMKGIEP
jgi:uncharacterized Rmd1/YagE family protein